MKKVFFTLLLVMVTTIVSAQTIFGKWINRDQDTGEEDSIIEVYEKDGKAYAKVVKIFDPKRQETLCQNCPGKYKDQRILGMNILTGLTKDGNEWSGGKIIDPKRGKVYKCFIKLKSPNKLKIRGYIGFSLIGKTKYWERKDKI